METLKIKVKTSKVFIETELSVECISSFKKDVYTHPVKDLRISEVTDEIIKIIKQAEQTHINL